MACWEKKIYSGEYLEIERYSYSDTHIKKNLREKRDKKTTKAQVAINTRNSIKKLARLMHCNFSREDIFITLTFKVKVEYKTAMNEFQKFIRRARYSYKDKLKYIACLGEDDTGLHFHLVIKNMSMDKLESLWQVSKVAGYTHMSRLRFDNTGLEKLARYFIKNKVSENTLEKINIQKLKKFWGSRNLKKPRVVRTRLRNFDVKEEMKNYTVVNEEKGMNEFTGQFEYIQMVLVGIRKDE